MALTITSLWLANPSVICCVVITDTAWLNKDWLAFHPMGHTVTCMFGQKNHSPSEFYSHFGLNINSTMKP